MDPKNQENKPLSIEIDDQTARGIYTNLAVITHNETEFVLDFLFLQPQNPKAKVLARLVSSPVHAKRFLWALKDNLEKYEARFGPIPAGPNPAEKAQPGVYQ